MSGLRPHNLVVWVPGSHIVYILNTVPTNNQAKQKHKRWEGLQWYFVLYHDSNNALLLMGKLYILILLATRLGMDNEMWTRHCSAEAFRFNTQIALFPCSLYQEPSKCLRGASPSSQVHDWRWRVAKHQPAQGEHVNMNEKATGWFKASTFMGVVIAH